MGGWIGLYRPLNLALIYFRNDKGHNPPGEKLIDQLREEHFWIPENSHIDGEEHSILIKKAHSGGFRFICILPTSDCDFKCAYCHQRISNEYKPYMTMTEVTSGMTKCAELCTDKDRPLDILIYGGEPLKAFSLTEKIIDLSCGKNRIFRQNVRLSFTTSGYGMQKYQADLLSENDVFVILSLDSPQVINDRVRYCRSGESSYEIALTAYQMLKKAGCRVGLSVTIGRHNHDNFADNLSRLFDDFHPDDIGLNAFLHPITGRQNPYQINPEEAFEAFISGLEITGRCGIFAEQPFRRLKPFIHRNPLLKDCSSPGERIVLVPGGKIGYCDSCNTTNEYFYPPEDFSPEKSNHGYQLWSSLSSPEMPECRKCPAMTVCGGACRYDAYKESGKLDGVSKNRCLFERMLLGWMIWELHKLTCDDHKDYYVPSMRDREKLMNQVKPGERNQPFTAGSYLLK